MAETTQQIKDTTQQMEAKPDPMKIDYDTVYLAVGDKICKGIIVKEGTYAAPALQHLRLKIRNNDDGEVLYENLNPDDSNDFWNYSMKKRSRGGEIHQKKTAQRKKKIISKKTLNIIII